MMIGSVLCGQERRRQRACGGFASAGVAAAAGEGFSRAARALTLSPLPRHLYLPLQRTNFPPRKPRQRRLRSRHQHQPPNFGHALFSIARAIAHGDALFRRKGVPISLSPRPPRARAERGPPSSTSLPVTSRPPENARPGLNTTPPKQHARAALSPSASPPRAKRAHPRHTRAAQHPSPLPPAPSSCDA